MATAREDSIPHVVRTAHEQRQAGVWTAELSSITQVNSNIRLVRLGLTGNEPTQNHLPGQYIDLYIPDIETVGGFTITSPPQSVRLPTNPYIELAIQNASANPPAAFLWRPISDIYGAQVTFRVGGNFIYPPATLSRDECNSISRAIFIAGGVGINPIMSMLSAMDARGANVPGGIPSHLRIIYTSRRSHDSSGQPEPLLFEDRLADLASKYHNHPQMDFQYIMHETSPSASSTTDPNNSHVESQQQDDDDAVVRLRTTRIQHHELFEALGPVSERQNTVVYVCGLPAMTDEFVELLRAADGMEEKRVLCEKWW